VFSAASSISITVIPGCVTDIVVRFATNQGRSVAKQLLAVHLFFPKVHSMEGARGRFAADHDHDLLDESFTALCVA
jgi:hypothetical protein